MDEACREQIRSALDAAGVGHEVLDGLVRIHLGAADDFVGSYSCTVADGVATATLVTRPFVPFRDRDLVVRALGAVTSVRWDLQRAGPRLYAFVLSKVLPPGCGAATVLALQDTFEELRDSARMVDRVLVVGRPQMAALQEAGEHELAGRVAEAITSARRGLHHLSRGASPRIRGSYQVTLGALLYRTGRLDDAAPLLEAGLAALAKDDPWTVAVAEMALAQGDLERNEPQVGLVRAERALAALVRLGSARAQVFAGMLRAQMLLACRQADDARRALVTIEDRVAGPAWSGPPRMLGDVRRLMALAHAEIGDEEASRDYLTAARNAYVDCGGVEDGIAHCDELLRMLDSQQGLAVDEVWQAWQDWSAQAHGIGSETLGFGTASPAAGDVPDPGGEIGRTDALKGALASGDLRQILAAIQRLAADKAAAGLAPAAAKATEGMPLIHRMLELIGQGEGPPSADWEATAEGVLHWSLEMLETVDRQPRLESVADRQRWQAQVSACLAGAAGAAVATDRPRLLMHLLERARAQGLPDVDGTTAAHLAMTRPTWADGLPESTTEGLSPDDRRLLGVRAYLSDLVVTPMAPRDILAETRLIGGPGAWRWTMWRASGLVFSSVLGPDAEVFSWMALVDAPTAPDGLLEPDAAALLDDQLGPVLDRLRRALRRPELPTRQAARRFRRTALLEDDDDAEPRLAWDLGRLLIPLPLRLHMARRLKEGKPPVPLVIAPSSSLADLPFALMAVDEPSDEHPLGRRLVEAAVITTAPPAALLTDTAPLPERPSTPMPVKLAVLGPTPDLRHIPPVPDGVPVFGRPGRPARRDDVLAALRSLTGGEPGVLVWAGHASRSQVGSQPLTAGLQVLGPDGSSSITVGDFILGGLHVPARALLHGCSTMGGPESRPAQRSNDADEWWGLPVALLFAGARAVVATRWDMVDCPAGAAIAGELVTRARTAPDLAVALREVQLGCLSRWAAQRGQDRTFTDTVDDCHPHLWGGWTVVGVAGG